MSLFPRDLSNDTTTLERGIAMGRQIEPGNSVKWAVVLLCKDGISRTFGAIATNKHDAEYRAAYMCEGQGHPVARCVRSRAKRQGE